MYYLNIIFKTLFSIQIYKFSYIFNYLRLANRRILELEGQIEDLHANQSAASVQEDSDLKQKLNSALKRQKEADAEIQNYSVTIESLESQIEVSGIK